MKYRKKYGTRRRDTWIFLTAVILLTIPLAACSIETSETVSNSTWADKGSSAVYDGKWTVESAASIGSSATVSTSSITVDTIPYADIMSRFFPDTDPSTATGAIACHTVASALASVDGGAMLYSIRPTAWEISATAGGQKHIVNLAFMPSGNGADNISWATVSKSGVLTLILHATAVSIDGGEARPASLTLTYTATRKQ